MVSVDLNITPVDTDEFQIGPAETYDVIINPIEDKPYAFVAESINPSGQAVATFSTLAGQRAEAPALRPVPTLTMKDMGMAHHGMNHESMADDKAKQDPHAHHMMSHHDHHMPKESWPVESKVMHRAPGVVNVVDNPISRLDEPGIGLEAVPHRTITYSQLRSLHINPDLRQPEREIEIHLTSNMECYMWSFDGVKFSEVKEPIRFHHGERLRVTLVNNTMMPHPIHLHGMFFDLVNGQDTHKPHKHTVTVKPAEKLSFDVSVEHMGDWAFHCHLLHHMHAGTRDYAR